VINELTELGERNIYHNGCRRTLAVAPLVGRADAILLFHDLRTMWGRHSQRDVVLNGPAAGRQLA
jgi:hypothetical protein